jgi:hypothetical protein
MSLHSSRSLQEKQTLKREVIAGTLQAQRLDLFENAMKTYSGPLLVDCFEQLGMLLRSVGGTETGIR